MRKRTGSVQKRSDVSWRIRYNDANGLRQSESFTTREEAERQLAIRLGELASGLEVSSKPNTATFEELAADVVNDYIVNGHRSMADIEARFRVHLNPVFGKRKASQITTAQIKAYIVRRQSQEPRPANGTINRELEAMRRAFSLALKDRKLLHSPHVPRLKEGPPRKGFFTRVEVERLTAHLAPPLDSFVWFAFLTGWRYEEIRGLEWRNVDFDADEVRLDPGTTKNDEGRVFPMSAELRAILLAVLAAQRASLNKMEPKITAARCAGLRTVFSLDGIRPVGQFRRSWKTACYRAGLPCVVAPVKKGGKKGAVKVVRAQHLFHDLRRSAVRELVRVQGLSEMEAMVLTGHRTRSVFDRYSIVNSTDLADIREKLNRTTKRTTGGLGGG
jgi:integrase